MQSAPGKTLTLTAVIAPDARAAAQYYPSDYWYSLAQVPPKSDFPGTGPQGNGINPAMKTQADWVWQMKAGCETCHQIGDQASRALEPQLGTFPTAIAAWDHRVKVGQDGAGMSASMNNYGRGRGLGMLADWTDRIKNGELPPAPSRPQGIERNVVLTLWEWGGPSTFTHDELATDKRSPTRNANGPHLRRRLGERRLPDRGPSRTHRFSASSSSAGIRHPSGKISDHAGAFPLLGR